MKKKIIALVLAAVLVITLAACSFGGEKDKKDSDLAYIQDKGTLIVGITDYAPMNYKEKGSDVWTGFDTEFAEAVAEKLGVKAEFQIIDWDNKYYELSSKSIDCIWNGLTITDEAKANASVSKPYCKNAQVVVMAADKLDNYKDADSIKDLKVVAEAGSAGEKEAKALGIKNYTAVVDMATAMLEVKTGSADASIVDITMANAMTGEGTSYAELGYKLELSAEEYGICFRKDSDMTEKVNSLMDDLKKDGTLTALAEKYELTLA